MLTITYYKKTRFNLLPLTLQLILTQWVSMEIQHVPPRCFQTQALITGKVTTALEMPQHFMMSMSEHRHIAPAHPTVKMAWHIGSVWWPCHKEPAKLGCSVHLLHAENFSDRIFRRPLLASVSSPLVSDVSILSGLCDTPCFSLSSTSFSSANRKTGIWTE